MSEYQEIEATYNFLECWCIMKILGYNYKVVEGGTAEFLSALGWHHIKSQTIRIADDLCQQQKESTILHEILESLNYHNGWELGHGIIMSLESSLYAALTENGVDLSPLTSELLGG